MRILRDGVALAYEQAGHGAPALLLVHGWGLDRHVLRPVFDFARGARQVVAIDLRGFGESDAPEPPYTIEGFADDLAALVEQLALQRPIVVGHSMGGMVALDFAARYADRVSAAVILEAMVIAPEPVLAGLRPMLDGLRTPFYRDVVARVMMYLAGPSFPAAARQYLLGCVRRCPQHVLISALEGILSYDSVAAARRVECPLFYVGTQTTYSDLERFRACCPQLLTEQLRACGHYFPLEAPAALNAALNRFLELGLDAAASTSE